MGVFMQGRYPIVLDQGGLDGVSSMLDPQQRTCKLCVGGWYSVSDQHQLMLAETV